MNSIYLIRMSGSYWLGASTDFQETKSFNSLIANKKEETSLKEKSIDNLQKSE